MPHIIVEHTDLELEFPELLHAINKLLVKKFPEEFPDPVAIKSRAINVGENYCIGIDPDCQFTFAFIHTNVRILSGRPIEVRAAIAAAAKTAIEAFMKKNYVPDGKHTQITVECSELEKETFQKVILDARDE